MWPNQLVGDLTSPVALLTAAGLVGAVTLSRLAVVSRRRTEASAALRRLLIGLAVVTAIGVAVVGGVRSFDAVSVRFGSPLVPLTADGMIVACTALRIAALTRGWRIPGVLATTYLFIGGTVWLNVAAAHDWSDAIAHALAPMSYAILVEMLAHLLRLHLHLAAPPRQRVAALAWATSPVVTTRVWLHLARTGADDPVEARALVQQLVRLSSRLRMVCTTSRAWRFGQARRARTAALQTVRDGLLTAHQLADLLPDDGQRLTSAVLLARVDRAALRSTAPARTRTPATPAPGASETPSAATPETDAQVALATPAAATPETRPSTAPHRPRRINGNTSTTDQAEPVSGTEGRSDAELVVELNRLGGPMSGRKVMRILGVGWPRAKRLVDLAGWADPSTTGDRRNGHRQPADSESSKRRNKPSDSADDLRTNQ
jgi:uncharacterized protein DUF2637